MVATGMMAIMTWLGLPRGLPQDSDWITRGRQASPYFAGTALLLLAITMLEKVTVGG